jgi:hypothetical protein
MPNLLEVFFHKEFSTSLVALSSTSDTSFAITIDRRIDGCKTGLAVVSPGVLWQ